MNDFLERCLWCALQVTLFTTVGATLYLLLRKQSASRSLLPSRCLAVVAVISILTIVPWPRWNWQLPVTPFVATTSSTPNESQAPAINPLPKLNLPALAKPETSTEQSFQPAVPLPTASIDNSPVPFSLLENWKQGLVLFATLITVAAILRLLIAAQYLFNRLRNSKLIVDDTIAAELERLQSQFQLSRKVYLRQSAHDDMPSTIGWRKPVILLPRSWRDWSTPQLRAVLAHELAHVHNHDFATWIAVQAPLLLHSYHPLVHWLASRVRWEQEISADRHAVTILGDRTAYLKALAELALGQPNRQRSYAIFSLAPNSSMILERLKMLRRTDVHAARPVSFFKRALILSALCLAALAISGLRGSQSTAIADEPTKDSSITESDTFAVETIPSETPASDRTTITALIAITPPQQSKPFSPREFEIYQQTQLTLFKSQFVLKAALAPKTIAELETVIKQGDNALTWLRDSLQVSYPNKGNILQVRYDGKENPDDMVKIINAVMEAYRQEISFKEMTIASARAEKLRELRDQTKKELKEKIDRHQKLTREIGGKESSESAQLVKIITNRLDRIDTNVGRIEEEQLMLRVELEQTGSTPTPEQKVKASFFERRLQQLEEKRTKLFEELRRRSETSGAVTLLELVIEQLREVVRDMEFQLRRKQITANRDGIRILQPATIGPAAKTGRQEIRFKEKTLSSMGPNQLKELRNRTQQELKKLVDRFQKLTKETGSDDTYLSNTMLAMLRNEIHMINSQISKAEEELINLEVNKTLALQWARSPAAMETAVKETLAQNPMLAQFKDEKHALAQQLRQLKAAGRGGNTKQIKKLRQQYQRIELEEKRYRLAAEADIRKKLKQAPNEGLPIFIAEYEMRKYHTTKKLKELRKRYNEKMEEALRKGEKSRVVALLESKIEQMQSTLQELDRQLGHE